MKSLLIAAFILTTGCASTGIPMAEDEVREYITSELIRIQKKTDATNKMFNENRMTEGEYAIMIDRILTDRAGIVARTKEKFPQ